MPARPWMSYVLSDTTAPRLARFAREVFGVEEAYNRKAAELGIQKVRAFNQSLGMPATLSEAGVPEDLFDEILITVMEDDFNSFVEARNEVESKDDWNERYRVEPIRE